jgi:chemotaxis protein CheC
VNEEQIDRLGELANIGAGHAATAFARLAGRPIWIDVPKIHDGNSTFCFAHEGDDPEWSTGVFFEFEGCLPALVGILFKGSSSETVVRAVVGEPTAALAAHAIESALMEIGNILASHVASAIADTVGVRLLPSIPTLAMHHADAAFDSLIQTRGSRHPIRIECELIDETGALGGLLVLLPDEASSS